MEKKLVLLMVADATLVASMLALNYLVLRKYALIYSLINFLSLFILAFPLVIYYYSQHLKLKHIESMFPVFLRDFVENVRGGLTVPQAFRAVASNDYRELSPYIKKIAAQLEWGIPVETVLLKFSREVKSKTIARIVSSVIESHRFGGNLADTFQALSNVASEVERLRRERITYLQSQLMTGYIIYFVFLGVMIGMMKFLIPNITEAGSVGSLAGQPLAANLGDEYRGIFRNLIIIQGLFAGLSVGKMAEGSILAGIKHSAFMMFIGGLVFTLAS